MWTSIPLRGPNKLLIVCPLLCFCMKNYNWPISILGMAILTLYTSSGDLGTQDIDVNNIKVSLERMSDFISNCHLQNHKEDKILCLTGFGKVVFELVSLIFKGGWDNLLVRDGQKTFHDKIKEKFTTSVPITPSNRKSTHLSPAKPAEFSNILPPLNLVSSSKGDSSAKNKEKKPSNKNSFNKPSGSMCSYTQVSSTSNI